jgi:hypothetical protein
MVALERDIEHGAEIELVLADIVAERGGIERDGHGLGRTLGGAQLARRVVAVLMQHQSGDDALAVAREADADAGNLGVIRVRRGREDRERILSAGLGKQPVVHAEHFQEQFVVELVGADVVVERRGGENRRPICRP